MDSSRMLFLFIVSILLDLLAPAVAQVNDAVCNYTVDFCRRCSYTGTYEDGGAYQKNLHTLLSSFSSNNQTNSGFYNSSTGQDPDKVNAIALCRGDVSLNDCHTCVNLSSSILFKDCLNQDEAIIWGERCMVRYSRKLIFGTQEDEPIKYLPSLSSATDPEEFDLVLNLFLDTLTEKAASGDSLKKFAAGHVIIQGSTTNQPIYALLQCTPDLGKQNCSGCLKGAISKIPECCGGKQVGRVLKPSCNLRFETSLFYDSTADSLVVLPGKKSTISKAVIVVIITVVAIVFVAMILIGIFISSRMRRRRKKLKLENDNSDDIGVVESLQYDFETIRSATDDFSDANKLGQGGFGAVYKGRLPNGKYIAVKRLSKNSEQGDREFKTEVTLVSQLHHRNLVRLLGFCLKAGERILIYEYVPNTSLNHFIFGMFALSFGIIDNIPLKFYVIENCINKRKTYESYCILLQLYLDPINHGHLNWETRYKIIRGISRGLLYLHEDSCPRIIHRDLKPSNILLDEDMNPKIADFGMAQLFMMDQTQGDTKTIMGTYGYMAPEYAIHGRFSVKSDVFSFGVLVLEILCGRKITSFRSAENEEDLLTYAWRNWKADTVSNIIDPVLTTGLGTETMRCIHIGLLCVQEKVASRPTMTSVVSMLNSHSMILPLPSRPAYYLHNSETDMTERTQSYESKNPEHVSINEDSITELYPR
ncbi:cysteine-rich receptor-like protein kinase 27 isoform X1 [Pyrus x bretschneideri]|uniref:cysteine-rich receptor-like protein kinase 27 isoform X1 n=1 Tax=Pyrus x bretschneideri TaxID=225117 RepID=UPI002030F388|nr:cysteine-rich receptor-like protein kinase 27 isoform X1 [Pyrus x bretschneideri]XP_048447155.1 cysteine-rich receptor-like protein kinase 27 isoform X1 [Pyrus x bretschneideri]XP_048447156.1 cysteine-rich receptor-like protein kinase 27 isoform X1 [Pyrus x bretschneideri]XP_048447157.1 cysteine-rich receptor-like protein kinase 27 isoform X1 [Pyrus x bretschneideri]XP_048447158.1 cysteine-rich receptor-like protein kinase 27 isoform X1 [Pyrus x bretschneideri]XP_048447159.1 cysteine-rich r